MTQFLIVVSIAVAAPTAAWAWARWHRRRHLRALDRADQMRRLQNMIRVAQQDAAWLDGIDLSWHPGYTDHVKEDA